jgi:hypothetical protein
VFKSVRALVGDDHVLENKRNRPEAARAGFKARVVMRHTRADAQHFFFHKFRRKKKFFWGSLILVDRQ